MAATQISDQHSSLYRKIRNIASGTFGIVTEVEVTEDFRTEKYNFVKGMKLAMKTDTTGQLGSISEIDILNRVNHPNIVNAYDTFNVYNDGHCDAVILVIPLATYSLHNYIDKIHSPGETMNREVVLDLLHQLLCGLFYLHSNHIIHDDIKSENVLLYEDDDNDSFRLKITDFGLSSTVTNPDGVYKVSQSLFWRPPEILRFRDGVSAKHSYESDVWAMGVVFLELISDLRLADIASNDPTSPDPNYLDPETPEEQLTMIGKFVATDYWKNWDSFTGVLTDAPDLISKMLDPDPKTRITSQEALSHSLFSHLPPNYSCEKQTIDTITWDIGMISASDVEYRGDILRVYKNIRWMRWEQNWNALFLGIDIADRYFTIMEQSGMDFSTLDSFFVVEVIDASLNLSTELSHVPYMLPTSTLWATVTEQQRNDRSCDILEKLNWKLYRPTLYSEHPNIDPEKLFNCYLETTEPALECVI
jgi:serine/threonine protein kinase